jgi:ribose 5-phosphate isomerase B
LAFELIGVASDHGGFALKEALKRYLESLGHAVMDYGTNSPDSVDYPDYAAAICRGILQRQISRGVLLCGTGIGASIAANRFRGIRAALCHDAYTAEMSRRHNDANILVMGGRVIGEEVAKHLLKVWLETPFEGGRHHRRLTLIEWNSRKGE